MKAEKNKDESSTFYTVSPFSVLLIFEEVGRSHLKNEKMTIIKRSKKLILMFFLLCSCSHFTFPMSQSVKMTLGNRNNTRSYLVTISFKFFPIRNNFTYPCINW